MTTFGALILGIIALVVGYNVAQPPPLNTLEIVIGWILLLVALLYLIFGFVEPYDGPRRFGRWR